MKTTIRNRHGPRTVTLEGNLQAKKVLRAQLQEKAGYRHAYSPRSPNMVISDDDGSGTHNGVILIGFEVRGSSGGLSYCWRVITTQDHHSGECRAGREGISRCGRIAS